MLTFDDRHGRGLTALFSYLWLALAATACRAPQLSLQAPSPRVYVGGTATCAISDQGDTYCWGRLGRDEGTPVRIVDSSGHPSRLVAYEFGVWQACGLSVSGATLCTWGAAGREPTDTAVRACPHDGCTFELKRGDLQFAVVTMGLHHGCGLTRSGTAYCWGGLNGMGQLGLGWRSPDSTGSGGRVVTQPRRVAGRQRFRAISAGQDHTCALTFRGEAFCWGYGQSGQLGIASVMTYCAGPRPYATHPCSTDRPTPVPTPLRFVAISAGMGLTCAVGTDSAAYCWGSNYRCALGTCRTPDSATPTRIGIPGPMAHVTAGYWFACALSRDARVYCWGHNASGQLGSLATDSGDVCFLGGRCTSTPQEVAGGHRWIALSAGEQHACGVTMEGAVYCWGATAFGHLGRHARIAICDNHSTTWKDVPCSPEPVPVDGVPVLRDRSSQ